MSPLNENDNPLSNKEFTEDTENDLAENLALILQNHPDLVEIIRAWPGLPVDVRRAIVKMVL